MKKLIIAASLAAATLGATSLMADSGHQRGQRQAGATAGCPMAEHGQGAGCTAQQGERHAQMQGRMQEQHGRMAMREHGQGRGMQGGHRGEHQNRGEGCPMQQTPKS